MADFKRSLAVVIGINEYQDYQKLQTPRYDAERLAQILAIQHKYDCIWLWNEFHSKRSDMNRIRKIPLTPCSQRKLWT